MEKYIVIRKAYGDDKSWDTDIIYADTYEIRNGLLNFYTLTAGKRKSQIVEKRICTYDGSIVFCVSVADMEHPSATSYCTVEHVDGDGR